MVGRAVQEAEGDESARGEFIKERVMFHHLAHRLPPCTVHRQGNG